MPHLGLVLFGACAVVAVAVVVIEEWPTIKETYQEVRARRRRRLAVCAHEHHLPISEEEQPMAASGINEPVQKMSMRSRNIDGKNGISVIRPFAINSSSEQPPAEDVEAEENTLIPSLLLEETPAPPQAFEKDVPPLIPQPVSLSNIILASPPPESSESNDHHIVPDLINPLDRPSTPEPENPFEDPEPQSILEDIESIPMSRTTSHTLSLQQQDDDDNSMSDWTEAFDNQTESEVPTDIDSDSDIVSDAESEASWARIRSRGVGFN